MVVYTTIFFNLFYMLPLWVTSNQYFCFTLSLLKHETYTMNSFKLVDLKQNKQEFLC